MTVTLPAERLAQVAADILVAAGVGPAAARTVAESLVEADARGTASHGLMLLPMYVDRLRAGSVTTAEKAEVVLDTGAVAVLDARHMLGQLSADQAMALAVNKAASYGLGIVTVRHCFHFGGAYRYVRQASEAGCLGVALCNTRPLMPAPGGATAVVGNNPVAVGVPRTAAPPVLLDMALSEAALGKIRLADAESREIPPTWATDAAGRPTSDPGAALQGLLLPIGGPKGFGLAFMVDVLTGVLSGGGHGTQVQGMYADVTVPNDCAHTFLALRLSAFGDPAQIDVAVEDLLGQVLGSSLAPGVDRVQLPGQREQEAAERGRTDGVQISESVVRGLETAAAAVGAPAPELSR